MKTRSIFIAISFLFLAYYPGTAQRTAVDATTGGTSRGFIKFDGIDGEAADKDHKNWCILSSFSQSLSRPVTDSKTGSATRRVGPLAVEDIVCIKEIDKSTPKLQEAVCTGRTFPKVEFELVNATGAYLKYELKNAIITSYSVSGEGDRPMEQLSLNYEEIKVTYTDQQAGKTTGNKVEFTWNLKENVK